MSLRPLLILLIISLYSSSHAFGAPEETRTLRLSTDRSTLPRLRVRVQNDPFYQRGVLLAEGVQLRALLEARFGAEILRKQSQYLLRFVCSDGYETIYPLSDSVGSNGVVADRFISWGEEDPSQSEGTRAWPEGQGRRSGTDAGPYYILWDQEEFDAKRPWPYQLTQIDLLPIGHLAALEPNPAAGVSTGHALFKTHCKACHKVNRVGGVMGPELNVPQNILSYRSRAQVKAFIRAPESFRLGSNMPAFQSLSETEVDAIIDYLAAMNDRRVCKDLESCRSFVAAQQASH